ncbi:multicopper oxidase family protein [Paenibacillus alginolyticus]|uniref:multicopper oxidase family protein n=1 Tax=Paenibacillus alginolyticus TaxID=59839 RepID=UPI00040BD93F|nr:multicopper oxidase family protein [Paenibacillus alginolyticus]MCY9663960.1 multicopper oxidase family protein [Paenibacillus alginolyticus]
MVKKKSSKRSFYLGVPLLLLIGVIVSIYFWQMRLQKPMEVNMANHEHSSGAMSEAAMHTHSATGVSCDSIVPKETSGPTRKFDLTAAKTVLQLDNGKAVDAWTFNNTSPGPELRVTEGDRVVVTLRNKDIEDGVTLHWHGINVSCSQDGVAGVTQDAVQPGEQFTYTFVASAPGTYWYHSHQMSSVQAKKGLLGSIIVEPRDKSALLSSAKEVTALYQRLDSSMLLNGSAKGLNVPGKAGEQVRLRLTNGDNETMNFSVDGAPFQVIAMDGHDLHEPGLLNGTNIPVGAGQRYDLLIKLPESSKVIVRNQSAKGLSITLGSGSEPGPTEGGAMFSFVDYGTPLPDDPSSNRRPDRSFDLRLGQSLFVKTINGRSFHEIPPMNVKEGERVNITLVNEGGGDHPFHTHGHTFRVLSKNGIPLKGSPVYLDTLLLKDGETYEVQLMADNPGLWMAHCHNLGHASMGMTMMMNYEGITTPYRGGTKSGNLPDL